MTNAPAEPRLGGCRRILVVRPDRIGDVVLSTPVLEALRGNFPDAEIHFLVRDAVVPVVEHNPHLNAVLEYRPDSAHRGFVGMLRLAREVRSRGFDLAVTLQASFPVSFALFLARVPRRIGPRSKWFSYVFFNSGVRQRRSAVEKHEADYNLALLEPLGIRVAPGYLEPLVQAGATARARVDAFLETLGLGVGKDFVVVHPGMGGSALNWPEENYGSLAGRLARGGTPVVVTGSPAERELVERTAVDARGAAEGIAVHAYWGELPGGVRAGLAEFMALLGRASVVVAPSTGPLHLASALGRPTVSFFPPIRVQSPRRWGPYTVSGGEGRHKVLVPEADCGQDFECLGPKCPNYFCMDGISVDAVERSVLRFLARG